jgi:hypothetical protein
VSSLDPRPAAPPFASDDVEHLRLLSIFHYVVAGLLGLASLFPTIHFVLGLLMIGGRLAPEDEGSRVVGWIMAGCASFLVIVGFTFAALVALAGSSLASQRRYTLCLVIAAILCVFVPFGTLLGVFTLIVLVRDSVRARFGLHSSPLSSQP